MSHWSDVLTRHKAVPVLTVVLAAILGAAAVGQISPVAPGATHDPGYPAPYSNSKADRALKAFDVGHPQCAIWSDWHKLCSRIGPNGATYCRTDPEHPTNPSAPFCAALEGQPYFTDGENLPKDETPEQRKSRFRFSHIVISKSVIDSPASEKGTIITQSGHLWNENRPFRNQSFRYLENPGCDVWSYFEETTKKVSLCSSRDNGGRRSCETLIHHPKYYHKNSLACSKWKAGWGYRKRTDPVESQRDATGERDQSTSEVLRGIGPNTSPFNEPNYSMEQ
ncbi:MAG: hypothetical protein ABI395_02295 [Sphingobium sp.]